MHHLDSREQILFLAESYETGLYAGIEVVGLTMDILVKSPDFLNLWQDVPEWAKLRIWDIIKECDENTVLHDIFDVGRPYPSNLIELKNWLISEHAYE